MEIFYSPSAWIILFLAGSLSVSAYHDNNYDSESLLNFGTAPLLERFSWKILDWDYPNSLTRQRAIDSGEFVPEAGFPVGIDVWRNKLFVTVPRWKVGIPATLNYIPLDQNRGRSPKLRPYPNWRQNVAGDCNNGFTTTYRIHVDKCDRLWTIDSGTLPSGNSTIQACPFTLKVFDLKTDRMIRRHVFPSDIVQKETFIANIAVDIGRGGCEDAFAYMSDELAYGLLVYDWRKDRSWRVTHSFFHPDPLVTDFNIAGLNYQRPKEGVFGMAVSPIKSDGFRTLYFHPFSSNREFAVSTRILRNKDLSANSFHDFVPLAERFMGHSTSEDMDENGLMVFALIDQNAVGCWNSLLPYSPENHAVIAKHDEYLIFPADVKIINGHVWIISDRMPIATMATLDYSDVNFRIFTVPLSDAIAGTVCQNTPNLRLRTYE